MQTEVSFRYRKVYQDLKGGILFEHRLRWVWDQQAGMRFSSCLMYYIVQSILKSWRRNTIRTQTEVSVRSSGWDEIIFVSQAIHRWAFWDVEGEIIFEHRLRWVCDLRRVYWDLKGGLLFEHRLRWVWDQQTGMRLSSCLMYYIWEHSGILKEK